MHSLERCSRDSLALRSIPSKLKRHTLLLKPHVDPVLSRVSLNWVTEETQVKCRLTQALLSRVYIPARDVGLVCDKNTLETGSIGELEIDNRGTMPDTKYLAPDCRAEVVVVPFAEVVVFAGQAVVVLDCVGLVEHGEVEGGAVGACLLGAEADCAFESAGDRVGGEVLTDGEGADDVAHADVLAVMGEKEVVG